MTTRKIPFGENAEPSYSDKICISFSGRDFGVFA